MFVLISTEILTGTLRENIEEIWFTLYMRGSELGSSGFEHSFIGEIDGGDVGGFHSWVSYVREESLGNANYKGWIEYVDFGDGVRLSNSIETYTERNF